MMTVTLMEFTAPKSHFFQCGSTGPVKGRAGAAVFILVSDTCIKKRVSDHLSVYTTELLAVVLALQWLEEKEILNSYCF